MHIPRDLWRFYRSRLVNERKAGGKTRAKSLSAEESSRIGRRYSRDMEAGGRPFPFGIASDSHVKGAPPVREPSAFILQCPSTGSRRYCTRRERGPGACHRVTSQSQRSNLI